MDSVNNYTTHVYSDYPGLSLEIISNDRPKITRKTICAPCWGLLGGYNVYIKLIFLMFKMFFFTFFSKFE